MTKFDHISRDYAQDFFISELPRSIEVENMREKIKNEVTLAKRIINDILRPRVVDA